jgi:hypothetical protein
MVERQLTDINDTIIDIVKDFVYANNILEIKNVSDQVFSRDETNIGVNTAIAPLVDIQQLIENHASKYEDSSIDFRNNKLTDGKGTIGIETYITIDTGNKESSQSALSDNGFYFIQLYNFLKTMSLPAEWNLYEIDSDIPSWFPYHSGNIYSIIIIRGLYEIK